MIAQPRVITFGVIMKARRNARKFGRLALEDPECQKIACTWHLFAVGCLGRYDEEGAEQHWNDLGDYCGTCPHVDTCPLELNEDPEAMR